MKVTLTKDGVKGEYSFEYTGPTLTPGSRLEVVQPFVTAGRHEFFPGDILILVEMTTDAPWGYHCSAGNWRVTTKYDTGVWTSILSMVQDGTAKLLSNDNPTRYERLQDADPLPPQQD